MVEVSGFCDGCGRRVEWSTVRYFIRIPMSMGEGKPGAVYLCHECQSELRSIRGDTRYQINQLMNNHGRPWKMCDMDGWGR